MAAAPAAGYDGMQFRLVARTAVCPEIFTPSATLSVDGDQLSIIKDLPNETIETCGDELVILVFEYANAEGILADLTWERSYDGQNWTASKVGAPSTSATNQTRPNWVLRHFGDQCQLCF
ncbi:MAG: hypothetical protein R2788_26090 [Saprospiraceae bacterium]